MKSTWQLWLNDKVSAGLGNITGMTDKAAKGFANVQLEINDLSEKGSGALEAIGSQVPQLSNALGMLSSPIGAIGVGLAATAGLLYKAGEAAAEFDSQFLELRQLNLSKPVAELDRLNDKVLEVAYSNGLNATATAKAYFDIQSATGKYGEEVDDIVAKTGVFAKVTKANLDSSIQGVAKSVNAFGLDAQQMDKYFASSFKTVQVGITTFDQLAEVQTDYAGAAAAAGQGFDDANKLFATFTTTAKSVNEAATLTKTAFQDITKKATIDGFKKIGVNVFDAEGKMRSLDAITRELVPRLGGMNDMQFAKLKEEIGGSEGIRGYLDKVKGSGESVISLLDTFDNTQFNLGDAVKNANSDFRVMYEVLANKVNVKLIELGQQILPSVITGLTDVISWLDKSSNSFSALDKELNDMAILQLGASGFDRLWSGLVNSMKIASDNISVYGSQIMDTMRLVNDGIAWMSSGHSWEDIRKSSEAKRLSLVTSTTASEWDKDPMTPNGLSSLSPEAVNGGQLGANGSSEDASSSISAGINGIAGGGQTVRNITVNIAKMVEAINIHTTETRQELGDIERRMEEYLVRAINGAEMAVSNG